MKRLNIPGFNDGADGLGKEWDQATIFDPKTFPNWFSIKMLINKFTGVHFE
jgi:hypothetical protein